MKKRKRGCLRGLYSVYFYKGGNKGTRLWLQSVPAFLYDGGNYISLFRLIVLSCNRPSTHIVFSDSPADIFPSDLVEKDVFIFCVVTKVSFWPCSVVWEKVLPSSIYLRRVELRVPYAVAWHWLHSQSSNYLKAVCARNVRKKIVLEKRFVAKENEKWKQLEKSQGERK